MGAGADQGGGAGGGMKMKTLIKDYPLSKVWVGDDGYIYKWQPESMAENEFRCLKRLFPAGCVPYVERHEAEVLKMGFIQDEAPTNIPLLLQNTDFVLGKLLEAEIRHGDLTRPNVLVRDNMPILLDFSESRLPGDLRTDKRPEGDDYWLRKTIEEIIDGTKGNKKLSLTGAMGNC